MYDRYLPTADEIEAAKAEIFALVDPAAREELEALKAEAAMEADDESADDDHAYDLCASADNGGGYIAADDEHEAAEFPLIEAESGRRIVFQAYCDEDMSVTDAVAAQAGRDGWRFLQRDACGRNWYTRTRSGAAPPGIVYGVPDIGGDYD